VSDFLHAVRLASGDAFLVWCAAADDVLHSWPLAGDHQISSHRSKPKKHQPQNDSKRSSRKRGKDNFLNDSESDGAGWSGSDGDWASCSGQKDSQAGQKRVQRSDRSKARKSTGALTGAAESDEDLSFELLGDVPHSCKPERCVGVTATVPCKILQEKPAFKRAAQKRIKGVPKLSKRRRDREMSEEDGGSEGGGDSEQRHLRKRGSKRSGMKLLEAEQDFELLGLDASAIQTGKRRRVARVWGAEFAAGDEFDAEEQSGLASSAADEDRAGVKDDGAHISGLETGSGAGRKCAEGCVRDDAQVLSSEANEGQTKQGGGVPNDAKAKSWGLEAEGNATEQEEVASGDAQPHVLGSADDCGAFPATVIDSLGATAHTIVGRSKGKEPHRRKSLLLVPRATRAPADGSCVHSTKAQQQSREMGKAQTAQRLQEGASSSEDDFGADFGKDAEAAAAAQRAAVQKEQSLASRQSGVRRWGAKHAGSPGVEDVFSDLEEDWESEVSEVEDEEGLLTAELPTRRSRRAAAGGRMHAFVKAELDDEEGEALADSPERDVRGLPSTTVQKSWRKLKIRRIRKDVEEGTEAPMSAHLSQKSRLGDRQVIVAAGGAAGQAAGGEHMIGVTAGVAPQKRKLILKRRPQAPNASRDNASGVRLLGAPEQTGDSVDAPPDKLNPTTPGINPLFMSDEAKAAHVNATDGDGEHGAAINVVGCGQNWAAETDGEPKEHVWNNQHRNATDGVQGQGHLYVELGREVDMKAEVRAAASLNGGGQELELVDGVVERGMKAGAETSGAASLSGCAADLAGANAGRLRGAGDRVGDVNDCGGGSGPALHRRTRGAEMCADGVPWGRMPGTFVEGLGLEAGRPASCPLGPPPDGAIVGKTFGTETRETSNEYLGPKAHVCRLQHCEAAASEKRNRILGCGTGGKAGSLCKVADVQETVQCSGRPKLMDCAHAPGLVSRYMEACEAELRGSQSCITRDLSGAAFKLVGSSLDKCCVMRTCHDVSAAGKGALCADGLLSQPNAVCLLDTAEARGTCNQAAFDDCGSLHRLRGAGELSSANDNPSGAFSGAGGRADLEKEHAEGVQQDFIRVDANSLTEISMAPEERKALSLVLGVLRAQLKSSLRHLVQDLPIMLPEPEGLLCALEV
jgi:hypothetical protein